MPLNLNLPPATLRQMNAAAPAPEASPSASGRHLLSLLLSAPAVAAMGDAGDLITTYRNMAKGAGDLNPTLVQGHPNLSTGILAAEDVAVQLALHRLSQTHPILAKVLGYSEGAMGVYNTIANTSKYPAWAAYDARGRR
jgi:hypothetical protein